MNASARWPKTTTAGCDGAGWQAEGACPALLCQSEAGIAINHMEMALLDERGVSRSQDVEIVDPGERLGLDGLPVRLAVACSVVTHDWLRRQADAYFGRTAPGSVAQGFGQGAGAGELASGGVHAEREFGQVADQQHGGDSQEHNSCSLVVLP